MQSFIKSAAATTPWRDTEELRDDLRRSFKRDRILLRDCRGHGTFETAKFYFIFKWGMGHEGGRNVGEIMESEDRIGGERIDTETKPVLGEERIATATRRTPARSHTSRRSPAAPDA